VSDDASNTSEFICPVCGGAMLIAPGTIEPTVSCPVCHTDLTISLALYGCDVAEDDADDRADELDHARITQRATLRRALYRSRSYAIIAAVVCAVGTVQLGVSSYHAIRTHAIVWAGVYTVLMVAGVIGAGYFYRRAIAFHHEAKQSHASVDPNILPDFSTLNSGSPPWEKLNDVR
jgi:hypothetical protein